MWISPQLKKKSTERYQMSQPIFFQVPRGEVIYKNWLLTNGNLNFTGHIFQLLYNKTKNNKFKTKNPNDL